MWCIYVAVTCLSVVVTARPQCGTDSGTEGITECVSSAYSENGKYQAAICMRKSTLKSIGMLCRDPFAMYCWYPCSFTPNSPGLSTCKCDPKKNPSPVKPAIPSQCFVPDGHDCSWYRKCLEARIPCESSAHAYAITYAEKYCKRYKDNYDKFSEKGKKWVDAVRKCLQESLVHVLYPQIDITCEDVKTQAFRSHVGCYKKPSNEIGLRDLTIADCMRIVWTVKGAIVDEYEETLRGSWPLFKICLANLFPDPWVKRLELLLTPIKNVAEYTCDKIAAFVAKRLAIIQKWSSDIVYYSYCPDRTVLQSEPIPIDVIISHETNDKIQVNGVVNTLKESASSGSIRTLNLDDGLTTEIQKIKDCIDGDCTSASFVVDTGKLILYLVIIFILRDIFDSRYVNLLVHSTIKKNISCVINLPHTWRL
jgi:hypothetical protein